ncbi:MAG: toprim domain-containing protein, partial [Candidatus Anstonellales archaeon]
SRKMVVTVMKKDKVYEYYFKDSKLDNNVVYKNEYGITGTIIECIVDNSLFISTEIDKDRIIRILKLVSSRFKAKTFFNDKEIESLNEDEYVKEVLSVNSIDGKIDFSDDSMKLKIYISCSRSEGKVLGDVNLHICDGTYISNVINSIVSISKSLGFESINKSDIEGNFKIYVSMYSSNATFDSQYKLKCTTNISKNLDNDLFKKSIRKLLNDEKFLNLIKEIVESKSKNKIKFKKRVKNENPLIDCIKHPGDTLYIVEGESACGTLREIINNKTEAIFPITGKILQTSEMEFDKVLKSKKMEYLFEAIGGGKRYSNYKILTDADSDGGHIAVLLIVAIYKFARNIINEGRLYLIVPPLYGKVVKGKFIPIYYTDGESKSNLIRFKGIGEMNPEELEVIIRGGYEYKIQPGTEKLLRILSDTSLKRKVSENLDFNKEKLVDKVLAIINNERRNDYGRESVLEKETRRRKTNN